MANDRILVSTEEMQAAIGRYDAAQQQLEQAYSKMDTAKEHMDNCYKGIAYLALAGKYVEIKKNLMTANRAIEETINGLRNTISTMETTESDVGSQSASLDVGQSAPTYL